MSETISLIDGNYLACRAIFGGKKFGVLLNSPEDAKQYSKFCIPVSEILIDEELTKELKMTNDDSSKYYLPTGGVFLFLKSIMIYEKIGKPFVVFDGGHSAFRKSIQPSYKQKDENVELVELIDLTPKELIIKNLFALTFSALPILLKSMGIPNLRVDGCEADDLIYIISKYLKGKGIENVPISDDEDYVLNIRHGVSIYKPMKSQLMTPEGFIDYYKFTPDFFPIYRAMIGDGSDNITGIFKVGPVTATKIVNQLEKPDLESLVNWCNSGDTPLHQKVKDHIKLIKRNTLLIDMEYTDAPREFIISEYENLTKSSGINIDKVIEVFNIFNFKTLGKWINAIVLASIQKNPHLNGMEVLRKLREGINS